MLYGMIQSLANLWKGLKMNMKRVLVYKNSGIPCSAISAMPDFSTAFNIDTPISEQAISEIVTKTLNAIQPSVGYVVIVEKATL